MVIFDPQEFMQLGIRLANSEPNEAGYRTAINRAYYACHLIGCESTSKKGWFYRRQYDARDHQGLVRALNKTPYGSKLRSLYELREHADYHIDPAHHTDNNCSLCESYTDRTTLVDKDTWEKAKEIALDIIPRLQDIMPSK